MQFHCTTDFGKIVTFSLPVNTNAPEEVDPPENSSFTESQVTRPKRIFSYDF